MAKQYWLSYSGFNTYEKCSKKYRLTRVDKEDPPEPDSKHNAVVGSVVQRVYEDFYNEELWRYGKDTSKQLLQRVDTYFYDFLDNEYVDFDDIKCKYQPLELLETCQEIVPKVLDGIKSNRLIGPYAKSEIKLRAQLQSNYYLFGIADFIIRQPDDTVLLIDGKSSKHREKYVDEDQLYFYALAFKLVHGRYPDKLGFFYYRFADDTEKAFDWLEVDKGKIRDLRSRLVAAFTSIQKKRFKATPKASHCQWCPWNTVCTERQQQKAKSREKRRWNRAERGEETLPSLSQSSEGSVMIGFGGKMQNEDS